MLWGPRCTHENNAPIKSMSNHTQPLSIKNEGNSVLMLHTGAFHQVEVRVTSAADIFIQEKL